MDKGIRNKLQDKNCIATNCWRQYQATWTSWTPSGEFLLFDRIQSSAALQESEIYRVNVHSGENILLAIGGKAVSNAG